MKHYTEQCETKKDIALFGQCDIPNIVIPSHLLTNARSRSCDMFIMKSPMRS